MTTPLSINALITILDKTFLAIIIAIILSVNCLGSKKALAREQLVEESEVVSSIRTFTLFVFAKIITRQEINAF